MTTNTNQEQIDLLTDYLTLTPNAFTVYCDENAQFADQVCAILADSEDDKLGRIKDLRDEYIERTVNYAIAMQWFGFWGELKRKAGLTEPTPFDQEQVK